MTLARRRPFRYASLTVVLATDESDRASTLTDRGDMHQGEYRSEERKLDSALAALLLEHSAQVCSSILAAVDKRSFMDSIRGAGPRDVNSMAHHAAWARSCYSWLL